MADQEKQQEQQVVYVERRSNGMAVAALVLGIIGTIFGLIPLTFFIALICGLLGFIFGIVGRRKAKKMDGDRKGMATAGLILGAIGFVLGIIGAAIVVDTTEEIESDLEELERDLDEQLEDL